MAYVTLKKHNHLANQIRVPNILSSLECRNIIDSANSLSQFQAVVGGNLLNQNIRETKVRFLKSTDETEWIWNKINNCIMQANQMFYHFDLAGLSELQLLEYEPGCFYDWHSDLGNDETSTRKISIILLLSDKNEYEGGDLVFNLQANDNVKNEPVEQGSMVIFPSFQVHKVTPVTSGKRFSLVGWAHGNAFL
jgi:PKHD-type hydroxylase